MHNNVTILNNLTIVDVNVNSHTLGGRGNPQWKIVRFTFLRSLEVNGTEGSHSMRTAVALSLVSVVVSLGYMLLKTPLFFLWAYGLLAAFLFVLNMRGCIKYGGSRKLLAWSVLSYMFGFMLWNIDNELCYEVRDFRTDAPVLLRPMTQLHAWWHFFAGIGTFLCIAFSVHLRLKALGYEPTLRVNYFYFFRGHLVSVCLKGNILLHNN